MSYSQLNRGMRTLLTGVVLLGIYAIYTRLTSPWLTIERARQTMSAPQAPVVRTADFSPILSQWFPQDQWVGHAGKKFRDGDRYLVFNKFSLLNENTSVHVSPVAMLWSDGDADSEPIRVTAASAQLDRSTAFEFEETEFGRITSGFLSGDVRMDGPNGLHIEGRNFYMSEKSMKIWSGSPVNIVWQTHQARAEGGIEIQLLTAPESKEGLLAITDIHSLRLNGRVTCNIMLPDKQKRREPTHLTINAANGFEFSVQTLTATFFGFEDKSPQPDRQILVQRPTSAGFTDRLLCTQLTLQLQPSVESPAPSNTQLRQSPTTNRPDAVELQSILAEGSRVVAYLEEQQLTATMTSLRYMPDQQRLELWDQKTDAQGRPYPVRIHQEGTEVLVPHVVIQHGASNQLHSIQLRGPGLIRHVPMEETIASDRSSDIARTDSDAIEAMWRKSCTFQQQPQPQISLEGDAQIIQTGRQFRLLAQRIDLTLQSEITESSPVVSQVSHQKLPPSDDQSPVEMAAADLNFAHIRPQKLVAADQVRISAPQITGTARQKLTVVFPDSTSRNTGTPDTPSQQGIDSALLSSEDTAVHLSDDNLTDDSGFTHFSADTMEASITSQNVAQSAQHDWSDIWLRGNVEIDYTAADPEQSFHAVGNVLFANNGLNKGRGLSLFGSPAAIVSASRRIEGQRVDLDEDTSRVAVEGSGRIRLVLDQGLDGRPLEKPSPLDIYWAESMSFHDRTAHFTGNIRAILSDGQTHDIELTCAGMKVHFDNDMRMTRQASAERGAIFSAQATSPGNRTSPGSNISRIECESRVRITLDQMMVGIVTAQHAAEFSDLKVNTQSGDFEASGPGWVQSTQPDRGNRLKVAPGIVATSNQPVHTSESPFVYVNATFIGSLAGNLNREFVQLNQHVEGVFGPVRRLGETINVNVVSSDQLPPQSGVLRCERLSVVSLPGPDSEQRTFSLTAEQNARIESRQLDGHADKITYDHSKQQFILRSEGNHNATVSHRQTEQGNLRTLVGQQFEYYPQLNKLKANQIIGLNANGFPDPFLSR